MPNDNDHYLKKELYHLVGKDESIFEFLQQGSLDGLWYWDLESPEHEWMSDKFWEILGYDPSQKEHLASEWQDLIHPDDLKLALENFHAHLDDPSHPYDQIVRYKHKDGSTVWVRCRGDAIRDINGTAYRMLGAHNDITELMSAQVELKQKTQELEALNQKLQHLSTNDHLTELYNRRGFFERAEWQVKHAQRHNHQISMLLVDIDDFKEINDRHGHHHGDSILKEIGKAVIQSSRETDVPARYGGDEFALALSDADISTSFMVGERLLENIRNISSESYEVTASIGVTTITSYEKNTSAEEVLQEMLKQSDHAMYRAKRKGKNQLSHFNHSNKQI